jgi:S1-C subfamily serine protease
MIRFHAICLLMMGVVVLSASACSLAQVTEQQQPTSQEPPPTSVSAETSAVTTSTKLTDSQRQLVLEFQQQRIDAINRVINSVVAIYGEDRGGGGSGVVITPSGIALTNHHVIIGAGVQGWGGMAGNKMYRWELIGTDPGGDVALIQMIPNDTNKSQSRDQRGDFQFPYTPLGDSDAVEVGDWALAMGNPFLLTEDQSPTVTMGIVSGIQRYQSGSGQNQLIYGNCIQVDSSINPGNSGGPLFNFAGEVIGINGRGSFQDRGRVNVGLGYAISSNQIKNFIPELLATKLVEHGTLDANFSDRGGKVVCATLSVDSPVARAGLSLGDQMLKFEGHTIATANQFTNLICTLPEGWPARIKIQKTDGSQRDLRVRLLGLPYPKPSPPQTPPTKNRRGPNQPPPTKQQKVQQQQMAMVKLLSAPPGTVRNVDLNRKYADQLLRQWRQPFAPVARKRCWMLNDSIVTAGNNQKQPITTWICADGRFCVESKVSTWHFDGNHFFETRSPEGGQQKTIKITPTEAVLRFEILQALAIAAGFSESPFSVMGDVLIDGSDVSGRQLAYRLVASANDEDLLYFWIDGILGPGNLLTLSKCSTDIDCQSTGVRLDQWENIADSDGSDLKLPMVRHRIQDISETVVATISNVRFQEISADQFNGRFDGLKIEKASADER